LGRIGRRVVLRCNFDHVAANQVETDKPSEEFKGLSRAQSAHLWRAGSGCKRRIQVKTTVSSSFGIA
jgi:hypothetical protein